jgi:hypothetical protein
VGGRWAGGLQLGYSWSDTPITVNWSGNTASVSYAAGSGTTVGYGAYVAGNDTLKNIERVQTTDFDDVVNAQGATLNHLGYLTDSLPEKLLLHRLGAGWWRWWWRIAGRSGLNGNALISFNRAT